MIYQLKKLQRTFDVSSLNRALNLARTQAACADIHALRLAIHNSANTLDVRMPFALCLQMGVADIHARLIPFAAYFTNMCHSLHLLLYMDTAEYPYTQ